MGRLRIDTTPQHKNAAWEDEVSTLCAKILTLLWDKDLSHPSPLMSGFSSDLLDEN